MSRRSRALARCEMRRADRRWKPRRPRSGRYPPREASPKGGLPGVRTSGNAAKWAQAAARGRGSLLTCPPRHFKGQCLGIAAHRAPPPERPQVASPAKAGKLPRKRGESARARNSKPKHGRFRALGEGKKSAVGFRANLLAPKPPSSSSAYALPAGHRRSRPLDIMGTIHFKPYQALWK